MVIIKSFLHLRPTHIVRMCSFDSEYAVSEVWPEVLLCMDKETAERLRKHLLNAYAKKGTRCAHNQVSPICIYRVREYDDDEFYSYVHRVPASIKNLQKIQETTGYKISDDISYV